MLSNPPNGRAALIRAKITKKIVVLLQRQHPDVTRKHLHKIIPLLNKKRQRTPVPGSYFCNVKLYEAGFEPSKIYNFLWLRVILVRNR
jgi:hypothetical protein